MTYLLELAGRPESHGIGPRSLKVATISVLMADVADGQADLPQLTIQGNYRSATAKNMARVYSRNHAHRKLFLSDFDQNGFKTTQVPIARKMAQWSCGEHASK